MNYKLLQFGLASKAGISLEPGISSSSAEDRLIRFTNYGDGKRLLTARLYLKGLIAAI